MHFSIAVLFAASLVSAFTVPKRQDSAPACATSCLQNSPPAGVPCNATDIPCLCLNKNFLTAFAGCCRENCSQDNYAGAEAAGEAYCKAAGVDLKNPVPDCAQPCFQSTPSNNGCASDDNACLCKDTSFVQSVSSCVYNSCNGQDFTTAELVGSALCRANGVDISSIVGAA